MVAFGNFLAEHLVPEWRRKYLRYEILKQLCDRIPRHDKAVLPGDHPSSSHGSSVDEESHVCDEKVPIPTSVDFARSLACVPVNTEITIKLKNEAMLPLTIFFWKFQSTDPEKQLHPADQEFFAVLNEDIATIAEFQFRILCQCLEERDILEEKKFSFLKAQEGSKSSPKSSQQKTPQRKSLWTRTTIELERKHLLRAYEQLFKLVKFLETYMNANRTGMQKILKKHSKHSVELHSKRLFEAICAGNYFPRTECSLMLDGRWVLTAVRVPLLFDTEYVNSDLLSVIENSYVELKTHKDPTQTRHAAMSELRKNSGVETAGLSQYDTFLLGLFMGVSVPLISYSFLVVIGQRDIFASALWPMGWMHFRFGALVTFQLWTWGLDLYLFKAFRINHALIFDIRGGTEIHYNTMLLIAAAVFLAAFTAFTLFVQGLAARAYPDAQLDALAWLAGPDPFVWPRAMAYTMVLLPFLPLPVLYPGTRRWLVAQLCKIAAAPLRAVDWPMFFLADQLCSHARTLHDGLFLACFAAHGAYGRPAEWAEAADPCFAPAAHRLIDLASGLLPPAVRLVQCARRYRDMRRAGAPPGPGNLHHLNGLKYALSMLVVVAAVDGPRPAWAACAAAATAYSFYWDVRNDWGLGDSRHGGLREETLLEAPLLGRRGVYYWAIGSNLCMRCAWVVSLSHGVLGWHVRRDVLNLALALVELARRAQWNVLRLEWEQAHNTGEWRAVKEAHLELSESLLLSPADVLSGTYAALRRRWGLGPARRPSLAPAAVSLRRLSRAAWSGGPLRPRPVPAAAAAAAAAGCGPRRYVGLGDSGSDGPGGQAGEWGDRVPMLGEAKLDAEEPPPGAHDADPP